MWVLFRTCVKLGRYYAKSQTVIGEEVLRDTGAGEKRSKRRRSDR